MLDYKLEIKNGVIEQLKEYAQFEGNEQCGVLTGSQIDANTFRISKVSPPCVAKNSRCSCERDAKKANEFIRQDYEQSERTRIYIGEWHTHPEKTPSPSGTDYSSIVGNFASSEINAPFLVMVIVGTESILYSIYNGTVFIEVEPLEVE